MRVDGMGTKLAHAVSHDCSSYATLAEGQVGWPLHRIWYETERVHESLDYRTPRQCLAIGL